MNLEDVHPEAAEIECRDREVSYLAARQRLAEAEKAMGDLALRDVREGEELPKLTPPSAEAREEYEAAKKQLEEARAMYNECLKRFGLAPRA